MKKNVIWKAGIAGVFILAVWLLILSVQVHTASGKDTDTALQVADLNGKTIGIESTSLYEIPAAEYFPDSELVFYNSYADLIQEVKSGRIDAYLTERAMGRTQVNGAGGLKVLDELLGTESYGYLLAKDDTALCAELNTAIAALKTDGTLSYLTEKWMNSTTLPENETYETQAEGKGVLYVATAADAAPFSFYQNGRISGFDVDVITALARYCGYEVQFTQYASSALANSVLTEREDLAVGGIFTGEEREENLLYTDAVYESGPVAVVADTEITGSWFSMLRNSAHHTLITEERWKQILSGILVTILISLVTLIAGSVLGVFICLLMRSERRGIARLFSVLRTILDAIPVLILLMIFYYVIFAGAKVPAVAVATVGLTLNFANTVAGLLDTGLLAVDRRQVEAAWAMGYRRDQIFFKVAFPQAFSQMYDQYIGAVTGMIKDTSIVSYITVQDLTSVTDSIRNATYQAFFPLLLTAVIYFLLAKGITALVSFLPKKFDQSRRRREIKGVMDRD